VFEVSLVKVLSAPIFVFAENGGWLLGKKKGEEEKGRRGWNGFENAAIDLSSLSASVRANGLRND
jgi:hypothetical protein